MDDLVNRIQTALHQLRKDMDAQGTAGGDQRARMKLLKRPKQHMPITLFAHFQMAMTRS